MSLRQFCFTPCHNTQFGSFFCSFQEGKGHWLIDGQKIKSFAQIGSNSDAQRHCSVVSVVKSPDTLRFATFPPTRRELVIAVIVTM